MTNFRNKTRLQGKKAKELKGIEEDVENEEEVHRVETTLKKRSKYLFPIGVLGTFACQT
jgi:hypothetical protein